MEAKDEVCDGGNNDGGDASLEGIPSTRTQPAHKGSFLSPWCCLVLVRVFFSFSDCRRIISNLLEFDRGGRGVAEVRRHAVLIALPAFISWST